MAFNATDKDRVGAGRTSNNNFLHFSPELAFTIELLEPQKLCVTYASFSCSPGQKAKSQDFLTYASASETFLDSNAC